MNTYHSLENWLSWVDKLSSEDYVVIDHFLRPDLHLQVREFFLSRLALFKQAGIGALDQNSIDTTIRGDQTFWLDNVRDQEINGFWDLVDEMIHVFNRYCFLSLSGYEFHLANYPPGGHYAKHLDQFNDRNNRMISVVLYLNEGWQPGDGGELKLFHDNEQSSIVTPTAGKCVLFKSATMPHQVLPAQKERNSLTGWLLYQPTALGQFLG
ncbi:MAG: 2OG-Fe(II) oxygenase [Cytophagales bacterium]|nr:2OG-Fe(II) oxygenase [Cytophagales bacterium]